jgi:hypothetical protein
MSSRLFLVGLRSFVCSLAVFACSAAGPDDSAYEDAASPNPHSLAQNQPAQNQPTQDETTDALIYLVGNEDCCATHASSGCFVSAVQECVCSLADRCCLVGWSEDCVALAADTCRGCLGQSFLSTGAAARTQGVTGYCAFNGNQKASAGGLLIGLFGAGGWCARRGRRRSRRRRSP